MRISKSFIRVGLLFALALACSPLANTIQQMALLFSHPSLLGLISITVVFQACVGLLVVGAWVALSINLKVWAD